MTTFSSPESIENARLLTLRRALQLELKGLKRRGRSVYSIVKEEFSLTGSKSKVFDAFDEIVSERTGLPTIKSSELDTPRPSARPIAGNRKINSI